MKITKTVEVVSIDRLESGQVGVRFQEQALTLPEPDVAIPADVPHEFAGLGKGMDVVMQGIRKGLTPAYNAPMAVSGQHSIVLSAEEATEAQLYVGQIINLELLAQ